MADIDVVAALADTGHLSKFDDRDVRTTIAVTNAGDGLSQAMAVDPREMHHGQEVVLVLRGVVSKVSFAPVDPKDEDSALIRIHTIKAGDATILDEDGVKKVQKSLDHQADRIRKALEAAQGVSRLPGIESDEEDDDDVLEDPESIR